MRSIEHEATSLNEFGLSVDRIMTGDKIEFDPVKKINKREDYVPSDFATKIVDAYAEDLLAAYRVIEALEEENATLAQIKEEAETAAETANGQVKKLLEGERELANAEKLLAKFEQQMETLAKGKEMDRTMIQQLKAQVNELIGLRDTVPQLEAEVNQILENLRSYFAEEGIPMEDDDYDYGYQE